MNDFVLSTQFRVFVAQCVKTMGTSRHNFFDPVGIQRANVLSRLHLKKEFVPGTAGRITGAGFLGPQNGEGKACMMQDLGNGQGDFFGTVIKTAGAAHPKKVFSVLTAGLKLGKRQDFHAMGDFRSVGWSPVRPRPGDRRPGRPRVRRCFRYCPASTPIRRAFRRPPWRGSGAVPG